MSHDPVFLHVGMPKTGTTYLQEFLWSNRAALAEHGLLYPADKPGRQFRAVLDLQGTGFAGNEISDVEGSWAMITDEARAFEGRSVISHEIMAGLRPRHIETVLETLAPREVHVVLTVRDLSRIVPATWQEDAKNRFVESWSDYLARVRPSGEQRDPRFWSLQDVPRVLEHWSKHVPAHHIHVVTVPPAGAPRHLLLERFCGVLGVDPEEYRQDVQVANDSIGPVEVALLHRINDVSVDRLPWPAYHNSIKHFAVPRLLAVRPEIEKMSLPESELSWVREETDRIVTSVRDLAVDVVGDLDDLTPRPATGATDDPTGVTPEQELAAAVDVTVGMAARIYELNGKLRKTRDEVDLARHERDAALAELAVPTKDRIKRRIVAHGSRNRALAAALAVYRWLRRRPAPPAEEAPAEQPTGPR